MKKYIYTSTRELRKAFWLWCEELGINTTGKKTKFNLDLNMEFGVWKDTLCRDGSISMNLYERATLY